MVKNMPKYARRKRGRSHRTARVGRSPHVVFFGRPRRAHAGAPRQGGENGKKLLGRDRRGSPGAELGAGGCGFVGAAAVTVIRIRSGLRMMLRACVFIRLWVARV